jgi:diacylglycerol O-acyltransferase
MDVQLYRWDTPETPMNMGNVCLWEGGPLLDSEGKFRLDDVRRAIDSRLHLVPRYRRKIVELPGGHLHPILVDDPHFDIANHVEVVTLPAPGTLDQLKEVFARTHEGRLDRSRPLWKLVFVDGLEDGRVGMIHKIHHAPFDGATTVRIMERLFDETPDAARDEPAPWTPQPEPHLVEVMAAAFRQQLKAAVKLHTGPYAWFRLGAPRRLVQTVGAMRAFAPAPPTSLNRAVGPRRRFDWLHSSIDEVRGMRRLVDGAKLNDVMLAAVAGGLRELFLARREDVTKIRPRIFVPVDSREAADPDAAPGNQVSAMVIVLPIHEPDATRRLREITDQMVALKAGHQSAAIGLISDVSNFTPPFLLASGAQSASGGSFMNLTVTNVPGPARELYLLGAKMLELNPMLPIGSQLTLNVAVESYAGKLSVGICCDPDAVPDLDVFRDGIHAALGELRELRERAAAAAAPAT